MSDTDGQWFVIHCESDDSHVVVDDASVIYGENVMIGDKVKFFFKGVKGLLEGTVKGFSGSHADMVKLQSKLNRETRPKRETSFHAGQPRKAKVLCKQRVFADNTMKNKKSSAQVAGEASKASHAPTKSQNNDQPAELSISMSKSTLMECKSKKDGDTRESVIDAVDPILSDEKADSSKSSKTGSEVLSDDSSMELSPRDKAMLVSLLKKAKRADYVKLKKLGQQGKKDSVSSNKRNSESSDSEPEKDSKEISTAAASKNKAPTKAHPLIKKRRVLPSVTVEYDGPHYLHESTTPKVEKLCKDYEVYILTSDLKKVKNASSTRTALARKLLHKIYCQEALEICSVSGKPCRGEVRPSLHEDGVQAIIDFCNYRGNKKNYRDCSPTVLKLAMANALCEERARKRLLSEDA